MVYNYLLPFWPDKYIGAAVTMHIHSNYTRKNRLFTVDLKTTENPAMRYSTFKNRWIGERFITSGCRIDFNSAITNLTVTNFSEDTDKLSDIPYE